MKPIAYTFLALCLTTYFSFWMIQAQQQPDTVPDPVQHLPKQAMILTHMQAIEHCQKNHDCPFPANATQPVESAIAKALQQDLQLLVLHGMQQRSAILLETAKAYLHYPDNGVQEAALKLLATQTPEADTIPSQ